MSWLDISIACFLMWGGIGAYLDGIKMIAPKLILLMSSILLAHFIRKNVLFLLVSFYPLEEKVHQVISSNLVVPVDAVVREDKLGWGHLSSELNIPYFSEEILFKNVEVLATSSGLQVLVESVSLAEHITTLFLNMMAFTAAVLLCYSWINLFKKGSRNKQFFTFPKLQWDIPAFFLGVLRNLLISSILLGFILGLHWLYPPLDRIFNMDESFLAQYVFYIYEFLGVI